MRRTLLLGHRGTRGSRHIPENTLASFELCLQQGCDGFEFDVRRSADGVGVICHDGAVGGLAIEKTVAADLGLPLLEDVLRSFAARAFLDIELKVAGLERQTIAALREYPPQKGYVVSSFPPEVLSAVRALDPGVTLGLLCQGQDQVSMECRAPRPAGWARVLVAPSELAVAWVIPQFELVDQALIEEVHASGKKIMVWTVNRAEDIRRFAEWGVDAIISDETELLVHTMHASATPRRSELRRKP
jgi:glycerophosphoryl diester phosphodiesterase